jgi:hypothetical protein
MEAMANLFQEFIMKAINLTENFLENDLTQETNLEFFTSNRERLFQVINQISLQVNWQAVPEDEKIELNRRIEYIKKLDEKVLVKLQEYQKDLKEDIERTVQQKEYIKGYNLSDVK